MAFRFNLLLGMLATATWAQGFVLGAETAPDFESEIAPILLERCVECHQPGNRSSDLSLTTRETVIVGGESGAAIDIDRPQNSLLLRRIIDGEMPPEEKGVSRKLPPEEIKLIERWIDLGAAWPKDRVLDWFEQTTELRAGRDWWSFQPINRPAPPKLSQFDQPVNPIDAFVLASLERANMTPAPKADRRVLIRRLFVDLIGIPPSEQQIKDFLDDPSPDAIDNVIDRLLAMPQYGERWARHWLDLARYADTSGYERDQEKPYAWKYRDWVVQALNEDMPYDQFIIQQIAGDEIDDRTEQSVVATGFLRLGAWNDEPNDQDDYQYERLEDVVHATASTFLGLTVKCARCHAHKFDPIRQEDYYRMAAVFWPGPVRARDANLLGGPTTGELGFDNVLGWTDITSTPTPLHLLKNGEREHPQQAIEPGSLSAIPSLYRIFDDPPVGARTTLRRLQLAHWIADPKNPLTPRVIVNRLWQHHFGEAIVRTPNNFGFLADPPTHPELLDWLAAEFIQRRFSIKQMHKLILTSQTWQQSSQHPDYETYAERDSTNRLWWRSERRRLDAESLRDAMLSATGELTLTVGGESFKPTIAVEALEGLSKKSEAYQASAPDDQTRRSLYAFMKRGLLPPLLTTFDLADATDPCGRRNVTTVPTQALALLNNPFVHDRSQHLASAIISQTSSPAEQVDRAWSAILKRQPSNLERAEALQHLLRQRETLSTERFALASLCHVLLNCNEFIYVD